MSVLQAVKFSAEPALYVYSSEVDTRISFIYFTTTNRFLYQRVDKHARTSLS